MNPSESIEAQLPPPRDDEPAGLRRAIIDELVDHLECAYRHELLRGLDAETARARALDRLGDPAALARRLWLDAMKGRIMRKRILIAGGVLVVLASLAVSGLAWVASTRIRDALAASQAANQEMLARLNEMSETLKHSRSPEWNSVKVVVTEETPDGPPVQGVALALEGSGANEWHSYRETDARGNADLGLCRPGNYKLWVERATPVGDFENQRVVWIKPGVDAVERVVCPRASQQRATVKVGCKWPRGFEKDGLYLYAPFVPKPRRLDTAGGDDESTTWNVRIDSPVSPRRSQAYMNGSPSETPEFQAYLFGSDGSTTEFREGRAPFLWTDVRDDPDGFNTRSYVMADIPDADRLPPSPGRARWVRWPYQITALMVLKPAEEGDVPTGRRRYEVVASVAGPKILVPAPWLTTTSHPPGDEKLTGGLNDLEIWVAELLNAECIKSLPFMFPAPEPSPQPSASNPNEWTIPFPDELARELRKALGKPGRPAMKM